MSGFYAGLQPALDDNGDPISGAQWYFYTTGTLTPRNVYNEIGLSTSAGSDITADSAGRFDPVFFDEAYTYRAILKDAGGATILDVDPANDPNAVQFDTDGDLDVAGNVLLSDTRPSVLFNAGGPIVYSPASNVLAFATGGTPGSEVERARFDLNGYYHHGAASVTGSARHRVIETVSGGYAYGAQGSGASYTAFQVVHTASQVGGISATSTTTSFNTTSDKTQKDDDGILSAADAWAILRLLEIHNYRWKKNGTADIGAFAQDLYALYPHAVTRGGWRDPVTGVLSDTEIEGVIYAPWAVDYSKLVPLLVTCVQDIDSRLAALEAA